MTSSHQQTWEVQPIGIHDSFLRITKNDLCIGVSKWNLNNLLRNCFLRNRRCAARMKILKFIGTTALAVGIVALVGCSAKNGEQTKAQTATVQRGNIVVSTTSAGNLEFTRTEDVAFEMAGTVQDVNVSVGDSVKEGDVLATLDTTAWDDQIKTLQQAVTTAQRNLTTAERNITSQQLSVTQAQLNLQSAQNATADIPAVQSAQDLVDNAQAAFTAAKGIYATDPNLAGPQIVAIQQQLDQAQQNLKSVLSGTNFNLSSDITLQISKAQFNVQQAQFALDSANITASNAIQSRDDAKQALDDAQSNLSDAQSLSPSVVAPFAGFITAVKVQGGEDVKKGAAAVTVADPTQFQVQVPVGEKDALSLQVGGTSTVSVNAMTGVTLPGKIIAIAPTATVQSGVVNYQVTVQVTSSVPVPSGFGGGTGGPGTFGGGSSSSNQTGQGQRPQFTGLPGNGLFPPRFTGTPSQGGNGPTSSDGQPLPSAQAVTLKQGLSVTVSLVTSQAINVLMVPNRAIVRQSGKTYVNVDKGGTTAQVAVTTGISNTQYTVVTDGLSEGDTVVIPATTVSSTTTPNFGGGGGIRIPGIGG